MQHDPLTSAASDNVTLALLCIYGMTVKRQMDCISLVKGFVAGIFFGHFGKSKGEKTGLHGCSISDSQTSSPDCPYFGSFPTHTPHGRT